ncbi:MAG: hypothetical protein KDB88_13235, partial [Flavobacteriales bacterium]|nr:hypothetical protein [Flavobacteriales bacterium]
MYRSCLSFLGLCALVSAGAQQTVHQVFVLNEGYYDFGGQTQVIPVSLGSFDPASGQYTEVATIPDVRFGNDVKVDAELVYVSADSFLLKYDANSYALLDQVVVPGIRRIAIWNDQLLVTRGEVGGLSHYFEVRDKATLDLIYTINPADGMPYSCEAVEVLNDKAYVSMNNGFDWPNYTNLVAIVDLLTESFEQTVDLGPDGYNPEHLMVSDGAVFTFNNKDYSGSSVSRIEPATASLSYTNDVAINSGCGTSVLSDGKIYFMEYSVDRLARFDIATEQVIDTLFNGISAYGTLDDPINGVVYVSSTDYISTGTLHIMTHDGIEIGSTTIGVAAGKMALDLRASSGIDEPGPVSVQLFPDPADEQLQITWTEAPGP